MVHPDSAIPSRWKIETSSSSQRAPLATLRLHSSFLQNEFAFEQWIRGITDAGRRIAPVNSKGSRIVAGVSFKTTTGMTCDINSLHPEGCARIASIPNFRTGG